MKRVCILLAMGLGLLSGSAVRAGDKGGVVGTLQIGPPPVTPVPAPEDAAGCCEAPGCGKYDDHWGHLWSWLCYKPPSCHCGCHCCVISDCIQPNYMFFLDMCPHHDCCQERPPTPCNNGRCGMGHSSPCADGGCGTGHPSPCAGGGCGMGHP
jgi:hypothetical protein